MPLTVSPSPIQRILSRTFLSWGSSVIRKWNRGRKKVVSGLYKVSHRAGGLLELKPKGPEICEPPPSRTK